ncbi:hypothetical protein [Candidatus Berkiella aquae]|uniref:RNase III inhibitor n=1 Tax=Candidatus Berkiella aquae TaxID=295108 RepID=A0A0Q9YI69_9GAMM|nr:hypothetical protein [Candidatus Berkiella aquae]MCS5711687.1 hypothetical protein [Candidatus Berkiella aquae]
MNKGPISTTFSNKIDKLDGRYQNPRDKNKILTPAAKSAVDDLKKFIGYEGDSGAGKFLVDSPLEQLLTNKIPSVQINSKATLTRDEVIATQNSVKIYADNTLDSKRLQNSLAIKNTDGTTANLDKKQCSFDAGRRVIISSDYIVNDHNFMPVAPVAVKTIAVSAPNLRQGKDTQRDYFINIDGTLNSEKYKKEMQSRVELMLRAMHEEGVTYPVIPGLGAGDFAGGFAKEVSTIIAQAIKEELASGKYPHFKGVALSMIDGPNGVNYQAYQSVFDGYDGIPPVAVTNKEMTAIALALGENGEIPGYVIADHPIRRPGNGWAVNKDGTGAGAQEETGTKHLGCYLVAQAHELNPQMLDASKVKTLKLNAPSQMKTADDIEQATQINQARQTAMAIKNRFGPNLQGRILISTPNSQGDLTFQFKDSAAANAFCQAMANGMFGEKILNAQGGPKVPFPATKNNINGPYKVAITANNMQRIQQGLTSPLPENTATPPLPTPDLSPKNTNAIATFVQGSALDIPADIYVNASSATTLEMNAWAGIAGQIRDNLSTPSQKIVSEDWQKHGKKIDAGKATIVTDQKGVPAKLDLKNGKSAFLIHASAPIAGTNKHDPLLINTLKSAYRGILDEAHQLQQQNTAKSLTVACAPLGIGIYGNDPKVSAKAAFDAIQEFRQANPNAEVNLKFGNFGGPKNNEFQSAFEAEQLKVATDAAKKTTTVSKKPNTSEDKKPIVTPEKQPTPIEVEKAFVTPEKAATVEVQKTTAVTKKQSKKTSSTALNDDLFNKNKAITPQRDGKQKTQVINDKQLSIAELHSSLKSKTKEELVAAGIKNFKVIEPATPKGSSYLKLDIFCTKDVSATGKTTDVTVEHKPGTEGITYAIKKTMPISEKEQAIERICKLAVDSAKPGTVFKIPTKDPQQQAMTEAALDKALQAKYPETYLKDQLKVPDLPDKPLQRNLK